MSLPFPKPSPSGPRFFFQRMVMQAPAPGRDRAEEHHHADAALPPVVDFEITGSTLPIRSRSTACSCASRSCTRSRSSSFSILTARDRAAPAPGHQDQGQLAFDLAQQHIIASWASAPLPVPRDNPPPTRCRRRRAPPAVAVDPALVVCCQPARADEIRADHPSKAVCTLRWRSRTPCQCERTRQSERDNPPPRRRPCR